MKLFFENHADNRSTGRKPDKSPHGTAASGDARLSGSVPRREDGDRAAVTIFPLLWPNRRRTALVKRMAIVLVRAEAFTSEREAVRVLMARGFSAFDVALLTDDARQVAMQSVVTKEMMQT